MIQCLCCAWESGVYFFSFSMLRTGRQRCQSLRKFVYFYESHLIFILTPSTHFFTECGNQHCWICSKVHWISSSEVTSQLFKLLHLKMWINYEKYNKQILNMYQEYLSLRVVIFSNSDVSNLLLMFYLKCYFKE